MSGTQFFFQSIQSPGIEEPQKISRSLRLLTTSNTCLQITWDRHSEDAYADKETQDGILVGTGSTQKLYSGYNSLMHMSSLGDRYLAARAAKNR